MFNLEKIVRRNILTLKPYSTARDEFSGIAQVYLDANENSIGSISPTTHNRYPDPHQKELKTAIAQIKNQTIENIFIANGSDEAIDLIIRIFCEPAKDSILILPPTYGMYEVSAAVNNIEVKSVPLLNDFSLDLENIETAINQNTKVIFLCSPNNPTANCFSKQSIEHLLNTANKNNSIVVIDEAYIDFCQENSFLSRLAEFPNLIVLQTMSKAWGLAEIRLGMAFASKEIVSILTKVKAPYNVSGVTQQIALSALKDRTKFDLFVQTILEERERLKFELAKLADVENVFESHSNFILVKFKDAKSAYQKLLENKIIVRDRSETPLCQNCLRITVGTRDENNAVIDCLRQNENISLSFNSKFNDSSHLLVSRVSRVHRKTSETEIEINLNIDGSGKSHIQTGLGFFDHMLTQITKHGLFDLDLVCKGDLNVDEHHTIEDTALALGEAFNKALGNKVGIERYGFLLPMDDALAQVAIDFSGRSWLEWNAEFKREKIGEMPCEMFKHFFKSFCDSARCNLNIRAEGENEHHKIEAIFKAFARSIREAVRRNPCIQGIPSSKGIL